MGQLQIPRPNAITPPVLGAFRIRVQPNMEGFFIRVPRTHNQIKECLNWYLATQLATYMGEDFEFNYSSDTPADTYLLTDHAIRVEERGTHPSRVKTRIPAD